MNRVISFLVKKLGNPALFLTLALSTAMALTALAADHPDIHDDGASVTAGRGAPAPLPAAAPPRPAPDKREIPLLQRSRVQDAGSSLESRVTCNIYRGGVEIVISSGGLTSRTTRLIQLSGDFEAQIRQAAQGPTGEIVLESDAETVKDGILYQAFLSRGDVLDLTVTLKARGVKNVLNGSAAAKGLVQFLDLNCG